jgi:hypothetical protein
MEVQDVNRLIKQFREAQKMMKMIQKTGGRGLPKMFGWFPFFSGTICRAISARKARVLSRNPSLACLRCNVPDWAQNIFQGVS